MRSTGSELLARIKDELAKARARKAELGQKHTEDKETRTAPDRDRGARAKR